MKYGDRYPLSNCIPLTTSKVVSAVFPSSTVITPSLPTFSMASAMSLPISGSLFADTVATCSISSLVSIFLDSFLRFSTTFLAAFSIPLLMSMGLAPPVIALRPSLKIACANTVAVVVPSPALSLVWEATSFTS